MPRSGARIGAELVVVTLVLAIVAGALALVVATQRRYIERSRPRPVVAVVTPPAKKARPKPLPPPPEPAPVEDPTPRELARIARLIDQERAEAERDDRRAAGLGKAVAAARRERERWSRREMLVRAQVDALEREAEQLEDQADSLARERDILARKRDEARSELARARLRNAVAVLPYRGPNGTWRRPIPVECKDGVVTLQPGGPSFSLMELESALGGLRSNPLVLAVASALVRAQRAETPDGAASVPYVLFIVRPDGIRPYYAARGTLEPLGINFGYELVLQDEEIDFPDLDDPDAWRDAPATPDRPAPTWPPAHSGMAGRDPGPWPSTPPGGDRPGGFAGIPDLDDAPGAGRGLGRPDRGPSGFGGLAADPADDPGVGGSAGGRPAGGFGGGERMPGAGRGGSIGRRLLPRALRPGRARGRLGLGRGSGWAIDEPREVPPEPGGSPIGPDGLDPGPSLNPRMPEQPPRLIPIPPPSELRTEDRFAAEPTGRGSPAPASATTPSRAEGRPRTAPIVGSGRDERATVTETIAAPRVVQPTRPSDRVADVPEIPTGLVAGLAQEQPDRTPGRSPGIGVGVGSPASGRAPDPAGDFPEAAGPNLDHRPLRRLELTLTCGPKGVVVYPGGYQLSRLGLDAPGSPLVQRLRAIVHAQEAAVPGIDWKPRLHFQVEPGGRETYDKAWRQAVLGGLDWPTTLRASERVPDRWLSQEAKP